MKWTKGKCDTKCNGVKYEPAHKWFAWHPVCINPVLKTYVWLEYVTRVRHYGCNSPFPYLTTYYDIKWYVPND